MCKICEIWSGSKRSPANRNVANALIASEWSDLVVGIAKPFALFVRDRAVIVYEHPVSGTEVARRFGFSLDTVQQYEQGRRRPSGPAATLLRAPDMAQL